MYENTLDFLLGNAHFLLKICGRSFALKILLLKRSLKVLALSLTIALTLCIILLLIDLLFSHFNIIIILFKNVYCSYKIKYLIYINFFIILHLLINNNVKNITNNKNNNLETYIFT